MTSVYCIPVDTIVGMASRWRTMTELRRVTFSPDTTPGGGSRGEESKVLPQNESKHRKHTGQQLFLQSLAFTKSYCCEGITSEVQLLSRENTGIKLARQKPPTALAIMGSRTDPNMVLPLKPQLDAYRCAAVKTTAGYVSMCCR